MHKLYWKDPIETSFKDILKILKFFNSMINWKKVASSFICLSVYDMITVEVEFWIWWICDKKNDDYVLKRYRVYF